MIDVSNLRAPGWQRVVAELSQAAPDDRQFLTRVLRVLAQVSASRQAVLWSPNRTDGEEIDPRAESVWPPAAENAGDSSATDAAGAPGGGPSLDSAAEAKDAARAAFATGQSRAFGLDKQQSPTYYDAGGAGAAGGGAGFVLAVPLHGGVSAAAPVKEGAAPPVAVITLLIEPRGKDAVRSSLAMAEVLAGYLHGHAARMALKRTQAASAALDLATRLIASINQSANFKGACIQLCNDLAKQFGVDRVALGWVPRFDRGGDEVKVQAISDTEYFDKRLAMVQKIQAAMDECLDQDQPVVYPAPAEEGPEGDVLLAQAITHAHRELASSDAKLKVCSLPLRVDEHVAGVVTVESSGEGRIDLAAVELMQAAMDLVAPVLRIRRSDDKIVAVRTWDSVVHGASWLVGSKHTVWKAVAVLLMCALLFVSIFHLPYRVSAEAVLEPRVKRILSAPFDAQIKSLGEGVEPGKPVKAGQVLVEFDTIDLRLGAADARAKIAQAEIQAAAARQAGDGYKTSQAEAQVERARAELDMYTSRLERSTVVAPFDGLIIAGNLKERIGSTMKLGEPLMQVAQTSDMLVVARVDERDIELVRKAMLDAGEKGHASGRIALKSNPAVKREFILESIVPLSNAFEGRNIFEVRAALGPAPQEGGQAADPAKWSVAGNEGLAKIDTERMSLLQIGTRRITDTIRLWVW